MRRIKSAILLTIAGSTFPLWATPYIVTGQLVESENGEAQAYATLRIFNESDTIKPVVISTADINGKFSEKLPESGNYKAIFSYTGMRDEDRKFSVTKVAPEAKLGKITMRPAGDMLQELVVTGTKPLIQADGEKLTYNVTEDPSAGTNTLIEMLKKVPMVTVDGQDNIKVNGQSDFKIYVNGKPDPMISANPKDVLKAMPASSVKKIEVITEPGAKYDAEGVGGILNIVTETKSSTDGYMASINISATNTGVQGGIYGMGKKGKLSAAATYAYGGSAYSNRRQSADTEREDFTSESEKFLFTHVETSPSYDFNMGNLQISFEADTLNLFTVSANVFSVSSSVNSPSSSWGEDSQRRKTWSYILNNDLTMKNLSVTADANYQHTFRKQGHNLTLSYQYNHSSNPMKIKQRFSDIVDYNLPLYDRINDVDTKSNEHTIQADYTNPFNDRHTLEAGAKAIFRRNSSDNRYFISENGDSFIIDPANTVDLLQKQDVAALYGSYSGTYGKFGIKAGVRYEYTSMGVDFRTPGYTNYSTDLNDIVPNFMTYYKISDMSNLRLSYQMRISRPSVNSLNPYRNDYNPGQVSYGNPDLSSERNNNVTLTYSNFAGKLSYNLSAQYSNSSNLISQYSYLQDGIQYTTYDNIGTRNQFSLSAYVNWTIIPKMSISLNGSARYVSYRCNEMHINRNGWTGNLHANYNYTLPAKFQIDAWGGFSAKDVQIQGTSTGWHYYGLSLSRTFLKDDRLRIAVTASDFFSRYETFTSTTVTDTFRTTEKFRSENWNIGLSVSLRIGGLTQGVRKTDKSIANDDLQQTSSGAGGMGSSVGGGK